MALHVRQASAGDPANRYKDAGVNTNLLVNPYWIRADVGAKADGTDRWLYTLQGIVVLDYKSTSSSADRWSYNDLTLDLYLQERPHWKQDTWGQWQECEMSTEHFSAEMHLNSIGNDDGADWPAWSIDNVTFPQWPHSSHGYVSVAARIGVRDTDGWVYRIGYTVHLYGSPAWRVYKETE